MVITEKFKKELIELNKDINYILKSNIVTDYRLENFLKNFEKSRYNILSEIKLYNKNLELEAPKIKTIDDEYKAKLTNKMLKIYIPEVLPSYKNIKTHTYKRILINVANVVKPFKDYFKGQVLVYIKVFNSAYNWDIDNRCIKPICDGLISSNVIEDDNINKMFYCVKGFYSQTPHTEVIILDSKELPDF